MMSRYRDAHPGTPSWLRRQGLRGVAVITPEAALTSARLLMEAAHLAMFGNLAPLDSGD